MKLAVRKEEGQIPGAGYHYQLMPMQLDTLSAPIWQAMGHTIIDVPNEQGQRLLTEAGAALRHQVEVALLTEKVLAKP